MRSDFGKKKINSIFESAICPAHHPNKYEAIKKISALLLLICLFCCSKKLFLLPKN